MHVPCCSTFFCVSLLPLTMHTAGTTMAAQGAVTCRCPCCTWPQSLLEQQIPSSMHVHCAVQAESSHIINPSGATLLPGKVPNVGEPPTDPTPTTHARRKTSRQPQSQTSAVDVCNNPPQPLLRRFSHRNDPVRGSCLATVHVGCSRQQAMCHGRRPRSSCYSSSNVCLQLCSCQKQAPAAFGQITLSS
ncbi:hypothetical protein COO60DRAFT_1496656 [Scenedesmus sp. NREL 46B-D3]|nr:hypothetical protein COO60DRAFT_1496656 [Scenedesmus sp. NREL 46B-D3]